MLSQSTTQFILICTTIQNTKLFKPFDVHCRVAIWVLGTAIKHPVPDRVKLSFVNQGTLMLSREHQSAQMSKITNDSLTRSVAQDAL